MKIVREQQGNAMIELSLMLPILILMLLGALDVGLLIRQSMVVASSARTGAEYALTWSTASSSAANLSLMRAAAQLEATNSSIPNYTATAAMVCTCGPGGATVACSGSCAGSISPAQYAQLSATATLPLIFGVSGLPASIPVKSVARIRIAWTNGN